MAKKSKSKEMNQYTKKSTAIFAAAACMLVGFFIGLNISLLVNKDSGQPAKPIVSVSNVQPMGESQPSFDFAALKKRANDNPKDANNWTELAHAYFDSNKYPEAIEAYEKSLAINANDANVWTDLGVMYRRNNKPQQAVECFTRASSIDPGHETARFNKGIVLLHDLNDRVGALTTWEVLLKINPEARTPDGTHLHDLVDDVRKGG